MPRLDPCFRCALTVDGFKQANREINVWTSSCLVAFGGDEPWVLYHDAASGGTREILAFDCADLFGRKPGRPSKPIQEEPDG